jgi:hypothetical protein
MATMFKNLMIGTDELEAFLAGGNDPLQGPPRLDNW